MAAEKSERHCLAAPWGDGKIRSEHANFKGKSVYYLADLHASQPVKGVGRYDKLARSYQITISSYTVFGDKEEYLSTIALCDKATGELYSDVLQIIVLELSKLRDQLRKPVSELSALDKWALFLRYAQDPRYRKKINEIIDSEEELQVAGEMLMSISKNQEERALYRSREKYRMDLQSNLATAWDNGHQEGLREGHQEGLREGHQEGLREGLQEGLREGDKGRQWSTAQIMLAANEPVEKILAYSGLTEAELEALMQQ